MYIICNISQDTKSCKLCPISVCFPSVFMLIFGKYLEFNADINILWSGCEEARKQPDIPVGWKPHISIFRLLSHQLKDYTACNLVGL